MPRLAAPFGVVAVFAALLGLVHAAEPVPLSVQFSDDRQQYRVCVASTDGQPVELDLSSLRPLLDCPLGVRILVANRSGDLLYRRLNPEFGYSPSDAISQADLKGPADWCRIEAGSIWFSPWYRLDDLLHGFEQVSHDPDRSHWQRLQLYVYVQVNRRSPTQLACRTEWWSPGGKK